MKSFILFFLCVILSFQSRLAFADIVNEFVQVQCNTDLNFLRIESFNINGDITLEYIKGHPRESWKKYGIISIDDELFDINPEDRYQLAQTFSSECILKKKNLTKDVYKIIIDGYTVNGNPGGWCGGHRSFSITIWRGKKQLLEKLAFAPNCSGNIVFLDSLTLNPHENYIKINGQKDVDGSDSKESFYDFFDMDEIISPLTNKSVYSNHEVSE